MELPCELHELVHEKRIVATKNYSAAIRLGNLSLIKLLCKRGPNEGDYIEAAAKGGYLSMCQWFYKQFPNCSVRHYIRPAIKCGHMSIIEWLCALDKYNRTIVANVAAEFGDFGVLEWIHENFALALSHYTFEYAAAGKEFDRVAPWLFDHISQEEGERALKWCRIRWCDKKELLEWLCEHHPEIRFPDYFIKGHDWIVEHKGEIELSNVLCHMQLPEYILEKLIWWVNLNSILKTQKISLEFCVKYILNEEYYQEDNETSITLSDVVYYQGYSEEEVEAALKTC